MATATISKRYTPEEYLAFELKSEIRHEFFNGEIFAMAGARREHNLIAGNLNREIGNQFKNRPCEVYMADMRVKIDATGLFTYPDVVAVCGGPRFLDDRQDTLLNPMVIVEVLSKTTEAYDRGDKFAHYRRLPSLKEYVLVAQDRIRLERYTRQGDEWLLSEISGADDALRLASIDCEVPVAEIYAKVDFTEPDAQRQSNPT